MWCVHVCVFSLSLFLFSLSVLVDLMYATSSTPGHVCLAEPTRGGWLVPPSLCLPTYLSGPVRSGQMPADSLALSFFFFSFFSFLSVSLSLFLSFLFLMTGMDGLYLSLPFSSVFYTTSSLCAPSLHHHHHHYPFC